MQVQEAQSRFMQVCFVCTWCFVAGATLSFFDFFFLHRHHHPHHPAASRAAHRHLLRRSLVSVGMADGHGGLGQQLQSASVA